MHTITSFSRRALIWAFAAVLALGVSGCGSETKERKAFTAFLQTNIVDKPGVRLPRVTPANEKSFGQYNKHFAVIRDFNSAMDAKVTGPMYTILAKGIPNSMEELMTRRADMATMRQGIVLLHSNVDAELAKADAQHASLKQPTDLMVVYDMAYARTVSDPANMLNEFIPAMEATLASAEKLAAFLEANKDKLKFYGSMMQVDDPQLQAEAKALTAQMDENSREIIQAQRKMNAMISGR